MSQIVILTFFFPQGCTCSIWKFPGVKSELQLPAYTTATATPDPSLICHLHHSSWQRQILNPLSEARDQTRNLMVPSQIHFRCAMMGTPPLSFLILSFSKCKLGTVLLAHRIVVFELR